MKYFEDFINQRKLSPADTERRRVAEYWRPGSTLGEDKEDYIAWLELHIDTLRSTVTDIESRLTEAQNL